MTGKTDLNQKDGRYFDVTTEYHYRKKIEELEGQLAEKNTRIDYLEYRIKLMLDDGYCNLYRKQAAELIEYTASLEHMEYPREKTKA